MKSTINNLQRKEFNMGTISFPDCSDDLFSRDGYDTWVLYHEGRNQFYGWANRGVNYGWTDQPVVTVMGSACVTPISKAYAEATLNEVLAFRSFDPDMRGLSVRKVHMTPMPADRNRHTWKFVA